MDGHYTETVVEEKQDETTRVSVEEGNSGKPKRKTAPKTKKPRAKRQSKTKKGGKDVQTNSNGEEQPIEKPTKKRKNNAKKGRVTKYKVDDKSNEKKDEIVRVESTSVGKRPKIIVMKKKHYDEKKAYLLIAMNKYPEKYHIYEKNFNKLMELENKKLLIVV